MIFYQSKSFFYRKLKWSVWSIWTLLEGWILKNGNRKWMLEENWFSSILQGARFWKLVSSRCKIYQIWVLWFQLDVWTIPFDPSRQVSVEKSNAGLSWYNFLSKNDIWPRKCIKMPDLGSAAWPEALNYNRKSLLAARTDPQTTQGLHTRLWEPLQSKTVQGTF